MDREYIKEIARQKAAAYGLPFDLIAAIITVESDSDPWAMRFEKKFLRRYVSMRPPVYGSVSHATERIQLATSWGLMQVMGMVARERGFIGPFLSELCEPVVGIDFGCRQLVSKRDKYLAKHGWNGVIAAYNGGSPKYRKKGGIKVLANGNYVSKVLEAKDGQRV